jgi:hypothetical protein
MKNYKLTVEETVLRLS